MGLQALVLSKIVDGVLVTVLDVVSDDDRNGSGQRKVGHHGPVGHRVAFEVVGLGSVGVSVDPRAVRAIRRARRGAVPALIEIDFGWRGEGDAG